MTEKNKTHEVETNGPNCPEPAGSAVKFSFMDEAGAVPVGRDNKVCWLRKRQDAIEAARKWGMTYLLELDANGKILRKVRLDEQNTVVDEIS